MLSATHPKEKGPCRASQPRLASPTRATCAIRLEPPWVWHIGRNWWKRDSTWYRVVAWGGLRVGFV
jgi:hypothetical protein